MADAICTHGPSWPLCILVELNGIAEPSLGFLRGGPLPRTEKLSFPRPLSVIPSTAAYAPGHAVEGTIFDELVLLSVNNRPAPVNPCTHCSCIYTRTIRRDQQM